MMHSLITSPPDLGIMLHMNDFDSINVRFSKYHGILHLIKLFSLQ